MLHLLRDTRFLVSAPDAKQLGASLAEVGPTKLDLQMLDWLRHVRLPRRFVATKADQVKPGRQVARRRELAAALGLAPDAVAWVSSKKGKGLTGLRNEMAALLELR